MAVPTRGDVATLAPFRPALAGGRWTRLGLPALLLGLAVIAWTVTDHRMEGMDQGPMIDLGSLGFFAGTWVVMMAAMMFPSIWPMVATHAQLQRARRSRGLVARAGATASFGAGYLVVWTAAGVLAYGLLSAARSSTVGGVSWDGSGHYISAAVLLVAALYQFTPAKDYCLTRCRGPLMFLAERWRTGRLGALRLGAEHGALCVGCCWGLMAALFALGVMSVGWMIFVAGLIAVEKLLPWQALATRGLAVVLLVLGLAVAITPGSVPGLDMSASGGGSMDSMHHMSP